MRITQLPTPSSTTTLTRREWREFLENNENTTFINGNLYTIKVRSIGGGMLQAYLKPFNPKRTEVR